MGMFDYVKVDPKHGLPKVGYQSKDFDCEMVMIEITADGALEVDGQRQQFHGLFNFYGFTGPDIGNDWIEYNAKFTDGALIEIIPVLERRY